MLTLLLVATLQQAPVLPSEPVTRESIHRGSPAGRAVAMTGMWFASMLGTAVVGIVPGLIAGAAGGGSYSILGGAFLGAGVGAGVGVLVSPLLMWLVGRAMDGKGSLLATFVGQLLGAALCGGLATAWIVALGQSYRSGTEAANGLGIALAVVSPTLIAGGPWAFEISHAVNAGRPAVTLNPVLQPISGGAIAGLSGTF